MLKKSQDEICKEGRFHLGKFRARFYEKKNPTKNGYFVKDLDINQVISVSEKQIPIANKLNEKNNYIKIICIKLKLKNEEGLYCLSIKI